MTPALLLAAGLGLAAAAQRRIAVVVGVDDHVDPALAARSGADPARPGADARALGHQLTDAGYEVWPLTGTVTPAALWQTLARATATADRDDLLLVFVASQARATPAPAPGARPALRLLFTPATADGRAGSVPLSALDAALAETPVGTVAVVVDAAVDPSPAAPLALPTGPRAWLVSAAPRRSGPDGNTAEHGILAETLTRALAGAGDQDGDGAVTLQEAADHTGQRTAEHWSYAVVPQLSDAGLEGEDPVLVGTLGVPTQAVLPWRDPDWRRWSLTLDGAPQGPGPVAPGRHSLRLDREDGVQIAGTVTLSAGEVLGPAALAHAARVQGATRRRVAGAAPPRPWQVGLGAGARVGAFGSGATSSAGLRIEGLGLRPRPASDQLLAVGATVDWGLRTDPSLLAQAALLAAPHGPGDRRLGGELGLGPGINLWGQPFAVASGAVVRLRQRSPVHASLWRLGLRSTVLAQTVDTQLSLRWSIVVFPGGAQLGAAP